MINILKPIEKESCKKSPDRKDPGKEKSPIISGLSLKITI